MRHVKAERYGYIDETHNHPVQKEYTFKSPNPNRAYVKVLKFVEKHPGCRRSEIQKGVWGNVRTRGHHSTLFSNMLYADILDYNDRFEYKVTRKGRNILKKVEKMV